MSLCSAFCKPQVPFEFQCEWPNGNSVTKQLPNYHLSDLESQSNGQMVIWQLFCLRIAIQSFDQLNLNLTICNLATVLLLNCHSAVQTQTQMEPEVFEDIALQGYCCKAVNRKR